MINRIVKLLNRHGNSELSMTEAAILHLIKKGVCSREELQKETRMSSLELERILERLYFEGYIEDGSSIQLKAKGFEYLLDEGNSEPDSELETKGIWLHYHVGKHLLPGEEILASCTDRKLKARFYATNKRMIRVHKSLFGESFHDISYKEISSISLTTRRKEMILVPATLSFILFLLTSIVNFYPWICLISFLLTAALLAWYYFQKETRYEFRGSEILRDSSYSKKWVINSEGRDVQKFVKVVRRMLDERNL